jgi:predicted ribonuclease YlaK
MNAGIYITESQNMSVDMMKLAIQRIGEDCVAIIDGDSDTQVDDKLFEGSNNGLRRLSEVFRGQDLYGEIELQECYRSRLAKIAEEM